MDVNEAVATYGDAWNETDAQKRRELLEKAWADDAIYQDPMGRAEGRDALVAHIGGFQEMMAGNTIESTSDVDTYGAVFRFSWLMRDAQGNIAMEGMDFGTVAADGRLASITGFFGPFPELGSA
jgi:hypothetical protein